MHALYPMTLHGAVLCRTGHELHILGRKAWLVRGNAPDLSRSHTTIPLAGSSAISRGAASDYLGATVVTLQLGAASFEILLPRGLGSRTALAAAPVA